jgi:hypothetical protein
MLMKQIIFVLTALITLIACNNRNDTKVKGRQTEQAIDSAKNKLDRNVLIEELKKLRRIIASNNKEKIAGIFEFPIVDTIFGGYVDDTTYYKQFKLNGDRTTKTMFLQHFKEISISMEFDQVNNLFKKIKNVDKLLHKDTLEEDTYIKSEPCFYSYSIEVDRNMVALRMDMQSNSDYKSKKASEDGIPENSSEFCEHTFWWKFKFDGKKLHVVNISGAD